MPGLDSSIYMAYEARQYLPLTVAPGPDSDVPHLLNWGKPPNFFASFVVSRGKPAKEASLTECARDAAYIPSEYSEQGGE